jgi:plasmid stabilization system protein ParE
MPRGDKSKYTPKQKRKAEHIEESYEARGLDPGEAEARAWATVNKQSGGGERAGSGRDTSAAQKARARKDSARRAVAAKHGHPANHGRMTARRPRHTSA